MGLGAAVRNAKRLRTELNGVADAMERAGKAASDLENLGPISQSGGVPTGADAKYGTLPPSGTGVTVTGQLNGGGVGQGIEFVHATPSGSTASPGKSGFAKSGGLEVSAAATLQLLGVESNEWTIKAAILIYNNHGPLTKENILFTAAALQAAAGQTLGHGGGGGGGIRGAAVGPLGGSPSQQFLGPSGYVPPPPDTGGGGGSPGTGQPGFKVSDPYSPQQTALLRDIAGTLRMIHQQARNDGGADLRRKQLI